MFEQSHSLSPARIFDDSQMDTLNEESSGPDENTFQQTKAEFTNIGNEKIVERHLASFPKQKCPEIPAKWRSTFSSRAFFPAARRPNCRASV